MSGAAEAAALLARRTRRTSKGIGDENDVVGHENDIHRRDAVVPARGTRTSPRRGCPAAPRHDGARGTCFVYVFFRFGPNWSVEFRHCFFPFSFDDVSGKNSASFLLLRLFFLSSKPRLIIFSLPQQQQQKTLFPVPRPGRLDLARVHRGDRRRHHRDDELGLD